MKTQSEILGEIKRLENSSEDFFGVQRRDLIAFLDFAHARAFLRENVNEEDWNKDRPPLTRDAVLDKVRDYLPFAWEKSNGCRGLSAARSMSHMAAWFWLLSEDEFASTFEDYDMYGKARLVEISERPEIAFLWGKHDNDIWKDDEDGDGVTAAIALGRPHAREISEGEQA